MNRKKKLNLRAFVIGSLLLLSGSTNAQLSYQFGIGLIYQDQTPEQKINISSDEYATFGRTYTTINASMISYKIKDRLTVLRVGF